MRSEARLALFASPGFRLLALLITLCPAVSAASVPPTGGMHLNEWVQRNDRGAEPEPSELKLINYFFTRMTLTNQLSDPSGLRGVSLGPIGTGLNSDAQVTEDSNSFYIEQRWIPVMSYSPLFADGLATFRVQLEVDFMWGLAANAAQHNQGGGFNADQVNMQTKNVNASFYPLRHPKKLAIVVGTQSFYDTPADPATTSLFDIVRTGYKLAFMGTDATGVAAYGNIGGAWKASFVPIGISQPDRATEGDPSFSYLWLGTLDYAYTVMPETVVGASFWRLQDNTEGQAEAYSGLVKSGPSSPSLYGYTGVPKLNIKNPVGSVNYLGAHFNHNIKFRTSDFGASGFVMGNFGHYEDNDYDTDPRNDSVPELDIAGVAANLELMYNWGHTHGDLITLEGMVTTGDSDLRDGSYSGVYTMNNYGLPGAVWFNHKTLLLFPFTSTVSNYTGAVVDISNQGHGLQTAILTGAHDLIPEKLNLKLGAAYAQSWAKPPITDLGIERGRTLGAEFNAELKYNIRYLMTIGLHAGYMFTGNYFNGNPKVAANPWGVFNTVTWYAF